MAVSKPLAHGGWVATMEDITERRRLEQERDRNYAFLSQIIDHIPSQITVKDVHDRRYLLVNRVAETQFGMSREVIVGKTAFDCLPEKPPPTSSRPTTRRRCNPPTACSRTSMPWESQGMGRRYITSRRIGIPRSCRASRVTSSTSSTT